MEHLISKQRNKYVPSGSHLFNQITFQMVNIQRQPNALDCGVFTIAGATELVYGKDPV